ncbi:MAG: pseudouridine synthase [Promicromonosporaceae bacterium]|nr:pseudouridine synthase [Promicromonosporaceae bacterium]
MPRRSVPPNLRPRAGLNPTRVPLPRSGPATALEYLTGRFPDDAARITELALSGEVFDDDGEPISINTPFCPHGFLYLFRDPPENEPEVPALAELKVLFRDDNLLVVDKPHQVAVIPRGKWVRHTALVYLRNRFDLPDLSPLHRLDRPTAGVLAFTVRPEVRGAYQLLFQNRQVIKEYLAVTAAPSASSSSLATPTQIPQLVESRIVKHRGIATAQEIPGEPNARTELELLQEASGWALFRLRPLTGKTHQLRLHLFSLGLPIIGDPFWPVLDPESLADPDPDPPLQLLARKLEFADPFTGETHTFISQRKLTAWPGQWLVAPDV